MKIEKFDDTQVQLINSKQDRPPKPPARSEDLRTLKFLVTFISVVSLFLSVIGYGAALARSEYFGFEVTDIYRSPTEFLILSTDLIAAMMEGLPHFPGDVEYQRKLVLVDGSIFAILFLIMMVVYHVYFKRGPTRTAVRRLSQATGSKLRKIATSNANYVRYLIALVGGLLVPKCMSWLIYLGVIIAMVLVSILPMMGYLAERQQIEKYIVNPSDCQHLRTRGGVGAKPNDSNPRAVCLAVMGKDGKEVARGRRIARNSESVFLYVKATGVPLSVPIRDAIVKQVDKE